MPASDQCLLHPPSSWNPLLTASAKVPCTRSLGETRA